MPPVWLAGVPCVNLEVDSWGSPWYLRTVGLRHTVCLGSQSALGDAAVFLIAILFFVTLSGER